MTFLKATKASFLVAEECESLVNCWNDLTRVRGVGPLTKRTIILDVFSSQGTREQSTSSWELGIEMGIWY